MSHTGTLIDMGELVKDVAVEGKKWSEKMFGPDEDPGALALGIVCLEGLVGELYDEPLNVRIHGSLAVMVLDCARRAGVKPMELFRAALEELRSREAGTKGG